jgi:hypothetical protein
LPPKRRRSLKDAVRDPLTAKRTPAPSKTKVMQPVPQDRMPTMLKVALGLLLGFAGGFFFGRLNRWI